MFAPRLSLLLAASLLLAHADLNAAEAGERSVLDSVYTSAQASRGRTAYRRYCEECHLANLQGGALEPPLVSPVFIDAWREDYLESLYEFISTRMPKDSDYEPGSLKEKEYVDIVAYILQRNDFPAGTQELLRTDMQNVRLIDHSGPKPLPPNAMVRAVGCLRQADEGFVLDSATAPARVRTGDETDAVEVAKSAAMALGAARFKLNNLDVLFADAAEVNALAGAKVQAKGVLNGEDDSARIFVLSLESTGQDCE